MGTFTRKFVRDNGTELEIDGSLRFESANHIEILEYKAWRWQDRYDATAPHVTLTEEEDYRLLEELMNDDSTWEYDDYD